MSPQVLARTAQRDAHPARFHHGAPLAGARVTFRLTGELDMATSPGLGRAIGASLDERPAHMVLDLREVTFLDSSGGRVLIAAARRARNEGCDLVLRAPSQPVLRMLRLTGLDRVLAVEVAPA